MPVNELEIHPFLSLGENILGSRMIVGTFPIFSLTQPRTQRKIELQKVRGDMSFFYGSRSNLFWTWYKKYVDPNLSLGSPSAIIASLHLNKIAISDVIKECTRIEESFEDANLRNKVWNLQLATLIEANISKVICTSKASSGAMGWLNHKVLTPAGFTISPVATLRLHSNILSVMPNSKKKIMPVAQVFRKGGRQISIVALPSPGSPQRRLIDFGYDKKVHTTSTFLDSYLRGAFKWFLQ